MGQRLGQHFLTDASWRARIARAIGIDAQDHSGQTALQDTLWVEIGAGHGEMTRLLAATGARVIAVELDSKLHPRLRALAAQFPRLEVVAGDILAIDLERLTAGGRFRVYGNLPYYITSPILHRLFDYADVLDDVHLVTQLEVAARIAARPGSRQFGYLSVLSQFYACPEIVFRIPQGAFRPAPKVTSALVHLKPPGERARIGSLDQTRFFEFVKRCFAQKRKTLLNNLRSLAAPERIARVLESLGTRAKARAEQLNVLQLAEIYRQLNASSGS